MEDVCYVWQTSGQNSVRIIPSARPSSWGNSGLACAFCLQALGLSGFTACMAHIHNSHCHGCGGGIQNIVYSQSEGLSRYFHIYYLCTVHCQREHCIHLTVYHIYSTYTVIYSTLSEVALRILHNTQ
jgi:hypothetical protein